MIDSWPIYALNDVCETIVDTEHKTAPTQETGYPSIRTPNVGEGRMLLDGVKRVSEETWKEWTRRAVPQYGDLIFAREAPLGNVAPVPKNMKLCLGQRTVLIRPNRSLVDTRFLCFLLLSPPIQHSMHARGGGATVPHINMSEIRRLPVPIPNMKTQFKVASILSAYDDLIENNLKRIRLLEELAQITYEEWFVRLRFPGYETTPINPETDLPEGWKTKKLAALVKYIKRGAAPKYVEDDGVVVINQKCVRDHRLDLSVARLTSKEMKISADKFVQHGDVLVNSTGTGTLGRVAQYFGPNKTCTVDTHVTMVRANKDIISPYVLGRFLEHIEPFIENLGKGATNQQELSASDMCVAIKMSVPPKDLQDKYEALAKPIYEEIKNLQAQNEFLKEARDILLPRLMTGMIDVEEYDPSKLLQEAA